MKRGGSISIWFFIGISLLVNGLLIFGAGVYEFFHPPVKQVVLYHLHANIWWGGILAVIGAAYCIHFAPGKGRV
ncbi:MAG TPA: hypothetical protein VJX72_05215 [Candidatus Acidoferrum sp.]|jgi:hypothetical protein|nr:hypothetical protein [Candidatus Acidoferrum sp.]